MEENSERNYKQAEEDNRLLILILVASFIIISMIIIIASTACILLCFEESIEEKEEEIQEALSKLTEKKRKGKSTNQKTMLVSKPTESKANPVKKDVELAKTGDSSLVSSDVSRVTTSFNGGGGGSSSENSCLLEQLRVSQNWRHLVNVEQGGQIKLNLREQLSAKL